MNKKPENINTGFRSYLFLVPLKAFVPQISINFDDMIGRSFRQDGSWLALRILDVFLYKGNAEDFDLLWFAATRLSTWLFDSSVKKRVVFFKGARVYSFGIRGSSRSFNRERL